MFSIGLAAAFIQAQAGGNRLLPKPRELGGWGVAVGNQRLSPAEEMYFRQSGLTWVRREVRWSQIESKKGSYEFGGLDPEMQQFRRMGVRPLLALTLDHPAYPVGDPLAPATASALEQWVRKLAGRYQGAGIAWEVSDGNRGPGMIPASLVVAKALRAVAPEDLIVGSGQASVDRDYIGQSVKAGLAKYWSAVSVRQGNYRRPELEGVGWARARSVLRQHPETADLPLVSTEVGSAFPVTDPPTPIAVHHGLANLLHGVGVTIWSSWRGADRSLLGANGQPDAELRAISEANQFLAGCTLRQRWWTGDSQEYVLVFTRGNQPVVAAWTAGESREVQIGDWRPRLTATPQYWTPEKRQLNLDLAVSLPFVPPYTVVDSREDLERLVRSVTKSAPTGMPISISMELPVIGRRKLETSASDVELERKMDRLGMFVPRSSEPIPVEIKVGELALHTELVHSAPLQVERIPAGSKQLAIRVGSVNRDVDATVKLTAAIPFPDVTVKTPGVATFDWKREEPAYVVVQVDGRPAYMGELPRAATVPADAVWSWGSGLSDGGKIFIKASRTAFDDIPGMEILEGNRVPLAGLTPSAPVTATLGQVLTAPGWPVRYGFWAKTDGPTVQVTTWYTDGNGRTVVPASATISSTRWQYVSFDLDTAGALFGRRGKAATILLPFVVTATGSEVSAGNLLVSDPYIWYER